MCKKNHKFSGGHVLSGKPADMITLNIPMTIQPFSHAQANLQSCCNICYTHKKFCY